MRLQEEERGWPVRVHLSHRGEQREALGLPLGEGSRKNLGGVWRQERSMPGGEQSSFQTTVRTKVYKRVAYLGDNKPVALAQDRFL